MKLANGLPAAILHFVIAVVVQLEILVSHVAALSLDEGANLRKTALIPLLWLELAGVSLLVGAVVALAWRCWPLRWLATCGAMVLTVMVAGDPIVFGLYGSHYSLTLTEGAFPSLGHLWDSAAAEASAVTWSLLVAATLGFVLLHLPPVHRRLVAGLRAIGAGLWRRRYVTVPLLVGWASASVFVQIAHDPEALGRHPLVNLALSLHQSASAGVPGESRKGPSLPPAPDGCGEKLDLHALRHGKPLPVPDFSELRGDLGANRTPMNLVVVVLESVGSLQLLEAGAPRADAAPRLRALSARAQVFDHLYNMFPGTVRSHVAIATGGRTVTWGGLYDELEATYKGPTLAGELRRAGYRTALVSAQGLDFENLGHFYRKMPWHYLVEPDKNDDPAMKKARVNTWGIDEAKAKDLALAWLRLGAKDAIGSGDGTGSKQVNPADDTNAIKTPIEAKDAGGSGGATASKDALGSRAMAGSKDARVAEPFFLQLLSNATHHPYTSPKDYAGPRTGTARLDRYLNALHYTDKVLGELVDTLTELGVRERTLIAVVGDHGQAFGDLHPGNLTHKNFLFEENVRNFLILIDPRVKKGRVSSQLGYLGDVTPTLLAALHRPAADMPGQDLFANSYKQQIQYFHKNAYPPRWGLVDGSWKYISAPVPDGKEELYDLESDPFEKTNVAAAHRDRLPLYACLARRWYMWANDDYLDQLSDFALRSASRLRDSDILTPGPKSLLFGRREAEKRFVRRPSFHPWERVVAFSEWNPEHRKKPAFFVWTSPQGEVHRQRFELDQDWSRVWLPYDGQFPLAPGTWTVGVAEQDQGPPQVAASFVVDPAQAVFDLRSTRPKHGKLTVKGVAPTRLGLRLQYDGDAKVKEREAYRVTFELRGPNQEEERVEGFVSAPPLLIRLTPRAPMAKGRWKVRALAPDGFEIASTSFRVSGA